MDGAVDGLLRESVDALSLDEALLLARELPHLGKLIRGELATGRLLDLCLDSGRLAENVDPRASQP